MAQEKGTNFEQLSLKDAIAKASADKKMIFIDCYTKWCVPCAQMAQQIFPLEECANYFNPKFVCVKVDMEVGEGKELMKKFDIKAFPTFLILDSKGAEINRIVGGSNDASSFIKRVEEALNPDNSLTELQKAYEAEKNMANGIKYVKAMMEYGRSTDSVLVEIYNNAWDYERYNNQFMHLFFSGLDYRSERFDMLMLDKPRLNQALGTETINRMIFDLYRKGMYLVAAERPHDYTVADVKKAALLTSLLDMPVDDAQTHLCTIALFVIQKDYDSMIRYYDRYIWNLPSSAFKGIVDGLLSSKISKVSSEQRKAIKAYFQKAAKNWGYDAKQYTNMAEKITE
ncbi:MAG: thioredoxin domain-containing protein [Bacteroidales bacterium]|nr:thioredoxin domain-containing protein [Bacteroidales bacterium]